MAIVWNGLALLFFVSLIMVSVSVFTPRTALFFKEKSKLRGAILWMSVALVCAVLVNEFGPGFVPEKNSGPVVEAKDDSQSAGLPGYSFRITEKRAGDILAVDCTLAAPVTEDILRQLALKVFSANTGGSYKEVRIQWFIAGSDFGHDPWGMTFYADGNWSVRILPASQQTS